MKRTILKKRKHFPKCIRNFKQLKGICIGQCIDKSCSISPQHIAHAHSAKSDPYRGWLCFRYKYLLKIKLVLLHEMAHLIANKNYKMPPHGKKWKAALLKIGGTFKSFQFKVGKRIYLNLDYTYRNTKI